MKKYIVELVGTFFLMFVIGCSVLGGAGQFAPIAIGLTLAVMVYAGGHISGAHYNPAVTVAVWLRGKCETRDVLPYVASQVLGALLAAGAVSFLYATKTAEAGPVIGKAFVAELLGTLALAWVVLNVATAKANDGNSFYGAAIGLTVTSMAYALGGVSGGAFNPAVAIGGSQMGLFHTGSLWVYVVACVLGGALAAMLFKFVKKDGD